MTALVPLLGLRAGLSAAEALKYKKFSPINTNSTQDHHKPNKRIHKINCYRLEDEYVNTHERSN